MKSMAQNSFMIRTTQSKAIAQVFRISRVLQEAATRCGHSGRSCAAKLRRPKVFRVGAVIDDVIDDAIDDAIDDNH